MEGVSWGVDELTGGKDGVVGNGEKTTNAMMGIGSPRLPTP